LEFVEATTKIWKKGEDFIRNYAEDYTSSPLTYKAVANTAKGASTKAAEGL
jgi:hypothetical protein